MAIYWRTGHLPEFAGVPKEQREEIVEAAILSLPITWRNLAVVVGAMLSMIALCLPLLLLLPWVACCWLLACVFALHTVFLNLARPGIREIIRSRISDSTHEGANA